MRLYQYICNTHNVNARPLKVEVNRFNRMYLQFKYPKISGTSNTFKKKKIDYMDKQ